MATEVFIIQPGSPRRLVIPDEQGCLDGDHDWLPKAVCGADYEHGFRYPLSTEELPWGGLTWCRSRTTARRNDEATAMLAMTGSDVVVTGTAVFKRRKWEPLQQMEAKVAQARRKQRPIRFRCCGVFFTATPSGAVWHDKDPRLLDVFGYIGQVVTPNASLLVNRFHAPYSVRMKLLGTVLMRLAETRGAASYASGELAEIEEKTYRLI